MKVEHKLFPRNHGAKALMIVAAILSMVPIRTFAQDTANRQASNGREKPTVVGPFTPSSVFLFNDNTELSSTTQMTVASLSYRSFRAHRLTIDYSSVGAVQALDPSSPALLFIGCFVDGNPCIGNQTDPSTTPAGWVNPLSCDFATPNCAAWDSHIGYVWFTGPLGPGSHTVVIEAAVGNPLIPFGGTGTVFSEARNLIVTLIK